MFDGLSGRNTPGMPMVGSGCLENGSAPSEYGNSSFADKRREWQILRKGVGAEG